MSSIRPSNILLHAGGSALARYGTLIRRTSLVETVEAHTRGSVGTYIDRGGVIRYAASNVPRIVWLDLDGDGVRETPVYRGEGARTNVLWDSSNFAAGTAWGAAADWTVAAATSIISGQTAYRHTNIAGAGFRRRDQTRGVFTGSPETFWAIIEQVDAPTCSLGIWDATSNAPVFRATFTFATSTWSTIDGAGTTYAREFAPGIWLVAVTATGTGGNSRRGILYPVGVANNADLSAIIHHAQHEEAAFHSSAMVTGSAAGFTRETDTLTFPYPAPSQEMTVYLRFVERGTAFGPAFISDLFGIGGGTQPLLQVDRASTDGRYRAVYRSAAGEESRSDAPVTVAMDDLVEIRATLSATGAARIHIAVNGGTEQSGTAGTARGITGGWSAPTLALGSATGFADFADVLALTGERTLAECREVVA